jgi:exonuclease III
MITLIQLNIERSKHLLRLEEFFEKERADVLCLQEVMERDMDWLQTISACPYTLFLRDTLTDGVTNGSGDMGYSGVAIFSRYPFARSGKEYVYFPTNGIVLEEKDKRPFRETNADAFRTAGTSSA